MNKLRQRFHRNMILQLLVILALYLLLTLGGDLLLGRDLSGVMGCYLSPEALTSETPEYQLRGDEDVLIVEKLWYDSRGIGYTVTGRKAGEVYLTVRLPGSEEIEVNEVFRVSPGGRVTCLSNGNYSNYRFHLLLNVLLLTLAALHCAVSLLRYRRRMPYSYDMMFMGGLLIWLAVTSLSQWVSFLRYQTVVDYYGSLQQSANLFLLITMPMVWIFSIALTVSNISLIRHESFRLSNALGILISGLLILGSLLGAVLGGVGVSGSAARIRVLNILTSSFSSLYSLMACLLMGAVLSGIAAARHTPSMDCDYIIILGCMIRKDGSLTPLLKSRVDRAIRHAQEQERATGRKAVFVPSGGQGRNEVMSEGEAMARYLLAQGIPAERILVEDRSRNTAENMAFSKALIDARTPDAKIAFSTTNYHVFRSGIIATQKDFCPEGMGSPTKWYFWPNAFIREFIGMLTYTRVIIAGIALLLVGAFAAMEFLVSR